MLRNYKYERLWLNNYTHGDNAKLSDYRLIIIIIISSSSSVSISSSSSQGRSLGGANGALAPGTDFEGAPKRQLPTGHTLIRSTLAWWFPHLQTKRVAKDFFYFGCIGFSLFWCVLAFTYVYSRYALCLLLQILLVAALDIKTRDIPTVGALDIKTRDIPTVSPINSLLSQYCKASIFFCANFYVLGGGGGANCSLCPGCPMGKDRPW
jgi:hypothetical protein